MKQPLSALIGDLSKKPKNTPWVYSGDELGGLEKPK